MYGLIAGEIAHGTLGGPVAGASVYAVERKGDRVAASGYSGTTNLSFNPATGFLSFLPTPADGIVDGAYVIPVPKGQYAVGVEAVDGAPAAAGNISFTCQIGAFYGQMNFNEEFYNRNREGSIEVRPGDDKKWGARQGARGHRRKPGIGLDFAALPDHSPPNFDWEGP